MKLVLLRVRKLIHYPHVLLTLFILLSLFLPFIQSIKVNASIDSPKVYDYYQLFSDNELEELEDLLNLYTAEGKVDIVVITTDNLDGKSKQTYMEDFYDNASLGYDKEFGDAVLLMLYMNPNDRSVEIQTYENSRFYVTDDRIENILDEIVPYLANGDYIKALEEYAKLVAQYMSQEAPTPSKNNSNYNNNYYNNSPNSNQNTTRVSNSSDDILRNPLVQLVASLILSGIVVAIMAYNSSGRITTNNRTYLNDNKSSVTGHHDIYLRTTVSRVRKPQNNDNNGGHTGGGTSSGGHSHGGGGRSF